MPLTPVISVGQTPGNPGVVTIADLSTGSNVLITQRRVYLKTSLNTYLVEEGTTTDYEEWALIDSSIDIDALDKDYGLLVTVEWLDVTNVVLYTISDTYGLKCYNEDFDYGLTQMLTANPENIGDNSFFEHKSQLRNYIDSGDKAIERASDIYSAQVAYDKATKLRIKSAYNFNINA